MDDILVSINKPLNTVIIFYNGTRLIKNANEYKDMNEEEIKIEFIKELKSER